MTFYYLYTELCIGIEIKTTEIDDGIDRIASLVYIESTSEHVLQFSLWPPTVLTSMYIKKKETNIAYA